MFHQNICRYWVRFTKRYDFIIISHTHIYHRLTLSLCVSISDHFKVQRTQRYGGKSKHRLDNHKTLSTQTLPTANTPQSTIHPQKNSAGLIVQAPDHSHSFPALTSYEIMSRQITQPVNQVRLTNVAVVRLSRHGNRFEVACYRNKIVNYRQGTETDLSEVLQTTTVFTNVSKGQFAKSSLLKECFGTTDEEEVCRFILDKGEVQISDQERAVQLESMLREVASMVSEKCINPANRRQYTMAQIRDAMKSAGFMVHPTRNVKQQFLDCVRLLQEKKVINIERAKMLLVIVLVSLGGDDDFAERRDATVDLLTDVGIENEHIKPAVEENDPRVIFKSDPSLYRKLEAIAKNPVIKGRLEIIQQCVTDEYDVTLGSDLVQTREQNPPVDTGKKPIEYISDDIDTSLSEKLKSNLDVVDKSSSPIQPQSTQVNSRKAQKAAQKKSKKAKRREN